MNSVDESGNFSFQVFRGELLIKIPDTLANTVKSKCLYVILNHASMKEYVKRLRELFDAFVHKVSFLVYIL